MSVILSWENPELTFTPLVRYVRIERGIDQTLLTEDAPWGIFEDAQNLDPNETYSVLLMGPSGNQVASVDEFDVRRFVRPDNACKISFKFINPDGSPGSCRKIRITHATNKDFSRVVCSNYSGIAEAFFLFGQHILIDISGNDHTLDCIIPAVQNATFEDLIANGSWVLTELRGMMP